MEVDLEKNNKAKPVSSLIKVKDMMYDYSLMVWDGLGFFGFDEAKLDRYRGKPVTFWNKCKSF